MFAATATANISPEARPRPKGRGRAEGDGPPRGELAATEPAGRAAEAVRRGRPAGDGLRRLRADGGRRPEASDSVLT